MPFTTPPTFVDLVPLSAAQLNVLIANQQYFAGLVGGVNQASIVEALDPRYLVDTTWMMRHKSRYLNLYIDWTIDLGWVNHLSLDITYGGTSLLSEDPWSPVISNPGYLVLDLEALGSFTLGTWYEIVISLVAHDVSHVPSDPTGSTGLTVYQIFESDSSYA